MSGKVTGAVSQKSVSHGAAPQRAAPSAVSNADASARWAALDSRYERLVTASDALLAEPGRCGDLKAAS